MADERQAGCVRPINVIVCVIALGMLAALLLPAIQRHPPGRRYLCDNNLRNIALALQDYHDVHKRFPSGATCAGDPQNPRVGPSWWYGILPFCEQQVLFDLISATQSRQFETPDVAFAYADMPDTRAYPIQTRLRNLQPDFMRCPASPLPVMENRTGPICLPSYVGIAGGTDIDANGAMYGTGDAGPPSTTRTYINRYLGTDAVNSYVAECGMLPPSKHVSIRSCTDGTSNTMIVSEQSDWLQSTTVSDSTLFHGDPGWNADTATAGGWISGTDSFESLSQTYRNAGTPRRTPAVDSTVTWRGELYNLTTVRYKPDLKRAIGLPGCAEQRDGGAGHNNPLQSPHPGGVLCAFVDGSVQFVSGTMDLGVLLRIAIRDDGQNVKFDD
jgi:hypothetical protein